NEPAEETVQDLLGREAHVLPGRAEVGDAARDHHEADVTAQPTDADEYDKPQRASNAHAFTEAPGPTIAPRQRTTTMTAAANTKRRTTCKTRARKRTAKMPAPVRSAQRPRKPGTDHVFPENVVCPLPDRIDALEESARPLLRVLGLQIRVLHGLPERRHVRHR